jgi:hypothetical protein
MFLVGSFSDSDQKFPACIATGPVKPQHETLVGVVPFIERPCEADAGLDGHDASRPRDFLFACFDLWHRSYPYPSRAHESFQSPACSKR